MSGVEVGADVERAKVAVKVSLAVSVTTQAPVPVQAPDHPEKVEPDAAVADKDTAVPLVSDAKHVEPQLMDPPVTVPEPVPVFDR